MLDDAVVTIEGWPGFPALCRATDSIAERYKARPRLPKALQGPAELGHAILADRLDHQLRLVNLAIKALAVPWALDLG